MALVNSMFLGPTDKILRSVSGWREDARGKITEQAIGSDQGQEAKWSCHNCPTCDFRGAGTAQLI